MNQILPRLFIGGLRDAKDAEQMKANDIRYVLSIHETAKTGSLQGVQYLCIQAADSPTQNLVQFFSQSNDFIHRCRFILRENGDSGSVLVHCLAGVSRSVTLLVAYLISITSLNVKQALEAVRRVRSIAEPNPAFHRQLIDFEKGVRLKAEQRRLVLRFPDLSLPSKADEEELRRLLSTKTVPRVEGPKSSPASSKATKFTFPHSQTPSGAKEWH